MGEYSIMNSEEMKRIHKMVSVIPILAQPRRKFTITSLRNIIFSRKQDNQRLYKNKTTSFDHHNEIHRNKYAHYCSSTIVQSCRF